MKVEELTGDAAKGYFFETYESGKNGRNFTASLVQTCVNFKFSYFFSFSTKYTLTSFSFT